MSQNGLAPLAKIVPAGSADLAFEARAQLDRMKGHWQEFWFEWADFYDQERWRALSYESFEQCAAVELGFSKKHAYRILDAAAVVLRLRSVQLDTAETVLPANEYQARALLPLSEEPERMGAAWQEALETAPRDASDAPRVTAAHVSAVVARYVDEGPAEAVQADEGPLDAGEVLHRIRRDLDLHLGSLHDLRDVFGSRFQADDMTSHEVDRFAGAVKRLGAVVESLSGLRAQVAHERTARAGAAVRRRPLKREGMVVERVAAAVAAHPRATSQDIAAATGIKLSTVSGRLSNLLRKGMVTRTAEQPYRYTAVEAGGVGAAPR